MYRYRPRWLWRWAKCRLGFHGWMMGPFDRYGNVVWIGGELIPYTKVYEQGVVYETCSFGWPWCKARRITDVRAFWASS